MHLTYRYPVPRLWVVFFALPLLMLSTCVPARSVVYLEEHFDGPLLWEDHTGSTYTFSTSGGVGHIAEVGGSIGDHYVSRTINLLGARSPHLEIDFRARADMWMYFRGRIDFIDPHTQQSLGYIVLCTDNVAYAWSHRVEDISAIVGNRSSIQIRVTLPDGWTEDHNQHLWFDNLIIWGMPHVSGIPDLAFCEGDRNPSIDLDDFVTDTSYTSSAILWSVSDNSKVHVALDQSTHVAYLYSDPGWIGVEKIKLTATSPDGLQGIQSVTVTVKPQGEGRVPSFSTQYLYDDFQGNGVSWAKHVTPDFEYAPSGGVGHMYETDGYGGRVYVSTIVNIFGAKSPRLELDYRASSDAYMYTNAFVQFYNPHCSQFLGSIQLTSAQAVDTGWKHGVFDIGDIVKGVSVVEIRLYVGDGWWDNMHQHFWFDNVQIWGEPYVKGIPDVTFDRKTLSSPIRLDDFVTAENKYGLSWSVYGDTPLHLQFDAQTRTARLWADPGWYGKQTVAVAATDSEGRIGYDLAEVTVNPLNLPAVFDSQPRVGSLVVDGSNIPATSLPKTLAWTEGTLHTVGVENKVVLSGTTRYVFDRWSDGSSGMSLSVKASENLSLSAQFHTEHLLEITTMPPDIASYPQAGWYPSGSELKLGVLTVTRYRFDHWVVDGSQVPSESVSVTMDGPHRIVAQYEQIVFTIAISSKPKVAEVLVDEIAIPVSSQPVTYDWNKGESHTVSIRDSLIQSGSTRYTFDSYSDGSRTTTINLTPNRDMTLEARYLTEHYLSLAVSPTSLGLIEGSGWYAAGTTKTIQPPSYTGYKFVQWVVDGSSVKSNALTVVMDRPHSVTATYELIVHHVKVGSEPQVAVLTVDGQVLAPISQPGSFSWLPGQAHTLVAESAVMKGSGTRYSFAKWADGVKDPSRTFTPTGDANLVAVYNLEYMLTVQDYPDQIAGLAGKVWHNSGDVVVLTAPDINGYLLDAWVVDGQERKTNPVQISMIGPRTAVARYVRIVPLLESPRDVRVDHVYALAWEAVSGAELYQLEEDISPAFSSPRLIYEGEGCLATTIHTQPGTYYYRARAKRSNGWGGWSDAASVTISPGVGFRPDTRLVGIGIALGVGVISLLVLVRTVANRRTVPSRGISVVLAGLGLGVCAVLLLVYMIPVVNLSGNQDWSQVGVPKGRSETVRVQRFGSFELAHSEEAGGGLVTITSQTFGSQDLFEDFPFCYYDGIIRNKILVFEWADSDVDLVYVRFKVMSNTEFEKYKVDALHKLGAGSIA